MKLDFGTVLTNLGGGPLKDGDQDISLGDVAVGALLEDLEGDRRTGAQKMDAWRLAQRISAAKGTTEATAEELALLKDRIGRRFPALIVGPAYALIEGVKV